MARILSAATWDQLSDGSQRYVGPIVECDCGKFIACNMRCGNRCPWCETKYNADGRQEFSEPQYSQATIGVDAQSEQV